jgi:hypothetical protein
MKKDVAGETVEEEDRQEEKGEDRGWQDDDQKSFFLFLVGKVHQHQL